MLLTQRRTTTTTSRDPDKFPAAQLFLLGTSSSAHRHCTTLTLPSAALVRVAEPIALTSIFPYAWNLVLHFHVGAKSNASFYAGLLISAFALAESITGMCVLPATLIIHHCDVHADTCDAGTGEVSPTG